jgi:hypothetical protein
MDLTQDGLHWWTFVLRIFRYQYCHLRDFSVQCSSIVGKCDSVIGINSKTLPSICYISLKLDTPWCVILCICTRLFS